MKKKRCGMCRHWQGPIPAAKRFCPPEDMLTGEWGYCKRHAPFPATAPVESARGRSFVAVWPETLAEDACGEFVLIPLQKEG